MEVIGLRYVTNSYVGTVILGSRFRHGGEVEMLVEMSNTKQEKVKAEQFRWTKPMSHMLLEILDEEVCERE
ncbi:unnamed protein product [Dovyalis caffra]|uniref:Uncharacterized protein n=1 Tax=Dovyalis caffra TaxID=77055 RepID=A0AAV1R741_9ROSI|nr:unnamed protein product [Dovyalis caffra]